MTEYQLLLLRFLRMKEEFPELNHRGHEPSAYGVLFNGVPDFGSISFTGKHADMLTESGQRRIAEREFYRPVERL